MTASAGSVPSRRFGAGSGRGRWPTSWPRWSRCTSRRSCWSPRTWPPTVGISGPGDRAKPAPIEHLVRAVSDRVARTRLLYLYPSELSDGLIDVMGATGCPYFDLSLQHVSPPLLRRMRRWGDGDRFLARIERIRALLPRRRPALVVHPGLPRRDRGGPRPAAGVPGRSRPGLGRVLSFFPRGRHLRGRAPGPGARRPRPRAPGRMRRAAGRHHRPPAPGPGRADRCGCWSTSRAWAAATWRRPRSTG